MTPEELQYCEADGCKELATMNLSAPEGFSWFGLPSEVCDVHGTLIAKNVSFFKPTLLNQKIEEIASVLVGSGWSLEQPFHFDPIDILFSEPG